MRRSITLVAVAVAAWLVGSQVAHGATTRTFSYDAAAFVDYTSDPVTTTHSGATGPCKATPTQTRGSEFKGSFTGAEGGHILQVQLPPGAKVTRLKYTILDQANDPGADSYVYLLRKRLAAGLQKEDGYSVMATVHSTGGVTSTRQFSDVTINNPVADPNNYTYFMELVNCDLALEPIGVQITMQMP
jgi:hypothetical protein